MADMMEKKDYDLTEITRLLLEVRDNCIAKTGYLYGDPKRAEKYDALNAAIFLINNPSTSKQWISVEDRLPKVHQVVIAHTVYNRYEFLKLTRRERPTFISSRGCEWWDAMDVTHWMPLPEPPKEDSHANDP